LYSTIPFHFCVCILPHAVPSVCRRGVANNVTIKTSLYSTKDVQVLCVVIGCRLIQEDTPRQPMGVSSASGVIKRAAQIADRLLSSAYREGTSLNCICLGLVTYTLWGRRSSQDGGTSWY